MEQRHLTLRVRPARLLVLIGLDSPVSDFVRVVRFLSQVWGGRFSPMFAVDPRNPDPLTKFRLSKQRPEFVFGVNLDHAAWERAVHECCQPRKYSNRLENDSDDLVGDRDWSLIHSDRAITAMFEARSRVSTNQRALKIVSVDPDARLAAFCCALFGIHPRSIRDEYHDDHAEFNDIDAAGLIQLHREYVHDRKWSWLDAGSYSLSISGLFQTHRDPTIVVVEDLVRDLCLFWSLRAATDTSIPAWVLPVPRDDIEKPNVHAAISEWLAAFAKYHMKPNYCVLTSASLSADMLGSARDSMADGLKGIGIEHLDVVLPTNRTPCVVPYEYETTWPSELDKHRLTIVPPTPRLIKEARSTESWMVDIVKDNQTGRAIEDIQLPETIVVPEILNGPCPPNFEQRVIPRFGDGVDAINFHCDSSADVVRFQLPTSNEILEEYLREYGCDLIPDEKRSSYLPTIERFGGLHAAASSMSGKAGKVLEILRKDKPLTPSCIKGLGELGKGKVGETHYLDHIKQMLRNESDRVQRIGLERYREYISDELPADIQLNPLLEHWANKSIVARRWEIGPCPRCLQKSFLALIDLDDQLRCETCGNGIPYGDQVRVAYTLRESIRHSLNEGLQTVVLTGRFLHNLTTRGFMWLPGVKYNRGDTAGDIDVFACCDGALIFAECKTLADISDDSTSWKPITEQFLELAELAIELRIGAVLLAAQVDRYPDDVKQDINDRLGNRIPHLLLDRSDLEAGHRIVKQEPDRRMQLLDFLSNPFPEAYLERRTSGDRTIDFGYMVYKRGR